jgi:hypothetical protein
MDTLTCVAACAVNVDRPTTRRRGDRRDVRRRRAADRDPRAAHTAYIRVSLASRTANLIVSGMQLLGTITVWAGLILMLVGGLLFLVAAFRESILWGLGVLFLPFVSLIFLVLHWSRAKDSFFLQLYGIALVVLAVLLFGGHLPVTTH